MLTETVSRVQFGFLEAVHSSLPLRDPKQRGSPSSALPKQWVDSEPKLTFDPWHPQLQFVAASNLDAPTFQVS